MENEYIEPTEDDDENEDDEPQRIEPRELSDPEGYAAIIDAAVRIGMATNIDTPTQELARALLQQEFQAWLPEQPGRSPTDPPVPHPPTM